MTSLDKDGFSVNALTKQAQSQRHSGPSYSISKVGREARDKVYISEEHIRCQKLGRESPVRNNAPVTSSLKQLPRITFGTGTRYSGGGCCLDGKKDDPGDRETNNELSCIVDTQAVKYIRDPTIIIGTDPRGKLNTAELIKVNGAAFYARDSPGPAAIGDEFGPDFTKARPRMAMARPFGVKVFPPGSDWMKCNSNPDNVGPGMYPTRDGSIGPQHLTQRRNQNVYAFSRSPKFPTPKNVVRDPKTGDWVATTQISELDAARSCFGKQVLGRNKSEPSINFNADDRDTRAKTKPCITKLDEGPRANMMKPHFSMPYLPPEHEVMRSGLG